MTSIGWEKLVYHFFYPLMLVWSIPLREFVVCTLHIGRILLLCYSCKEKSSFVKTHRQKSLTTQVNDIYVCIFSPMYLIFQSIAVLLTFLCISTTKHFLPKGLCLDTMYIRAIYRIIYAYTSISSNRWCLLVVFSYCDFFHDRSTLRLLGLQK